VDLWNEPDNGNADSYARAIQKIKTRSFSAYCHRSLPGFALRTAQPLTSVCGTATGARWPPCRRWPASSRAIRHCHFHNYSWPEDFEQHVKFLEQFHRPSFAPNTWRAVLAALRHRASHRPKAPRWGHQLGLVRARARPGCPGFLATSVCDEQPAVWHTMSSTRRNTLPTAGGGDHPQPDEREVDTRIISDFLQEFE